LFLKEGADLLIYEYASKLQYSAPSGRA